MSDGGARRAELAALAAHFAEASATFPGSPLYRTLAPAIARDAGVLELLTARRPGQQPSFLLFGAVQYLLLAEPDDPLRAHYPTLGGAADLDPVLAAHRFLDFCRRHRDELAAVVQERLVQTNVVKRACAVAFALAAIRRRCAAPVHLVEVGASAGCLLRFDRYRLVLGDRACGDPASPVTVRTAWRGAEPPPDLDDRPAIASRVGVDLEPVDARDADQRRWLRALVWPEDREKAELLAAALELVAADPPTIVAGDAVDVLPALLLPAGEPRVVCHFATRMHVPVERRAAFDAAIDALAEGGPLFHVWLEPPSAPHDGWSAHPHGALELHGPGDAAPVPLARGDGHLEWLAPLEGSR